MSGGACQKGARNFARYHANSYNTAGPRDNTEKAPPFRSLCTCRWRNSGNLKKLPKNTFLLTFSLFWCFCAGHLVFMKISTRSGRSEYRDFAVITSSRSAANESRGQRSHFVGLKKSEGKEHVTTFQVTWPFIGVIRVRRQKKADVSSVYLRIYCIFPTFHGKSIPYRLPQYRR